MADREAAWTAAIGSVVRELRTRRGLSQVELAARAGKPGQNSYISRLETGKWSAPRTVELLDIVAPLLGTTREFVESQARRVLAGDVVASAHDAPSASTPTAPTSAAPAETPPVAVPSAPDLVRPSDPTVTSSTLEACVSFTEAHLLWVLEEPTEELDAFEVHALATALAHLEEVRDRRAGRGE